MPKTQDDLTHPVIHRMNGDPDTWAANLDLIITNVFSKLL